MKKINIADTLALILLILQIFAPYLSNLVNPNILIMLINCYIIGYISYIISFTDSKKVALMALPLVVYTVFLLFFTRGFKIPSPNAAIADITNILSNIFDVMFVSFVFFIIEQVANKIAGGKFTVALAILGLILYLIMQNTNILPFDIYYKDLFVYFSFYVMAAKIKPAVTINKLLYPLAILLLIGEIIAYVYYKIYPGIYFALYLLTYVVLKDMANVEGINRQRYLTFAYLYPYWVILVVLNEYIKASPLVVNIMAVLVTYVLSELAYRLRFKVIDYLYVGVH